MWFWVFGLWVRLGFFFSFFSPSLSLFFFSFFSLLFFLFIFHFVSQFFFFSGWASVILRFVFVFVAVVVFTLSLSLCMHGIYVADVGFL